MSKWSRPLSFVVAVACAASGRAAAVDPPKPSEAGARAAARYVSETGADLAALDSHFRKYREAAEQLSALCAKLSANSAFTQQYLQLQSQMQNENRSYTAVSNIMKTKHDTVKNSISNVR